MGHRHSRTDNEPSGASIPRVEWTLLLLAACVVIGALVAPPVHRALVWTGRHASTLEFLRDLSFERVLTRCILVVLVLALLREVRPGGALRTLAFSLVDLPRWKRDAATGCVAGLFAMLGLWCIAAFAGAYDAGPDLSAHVVGSWLLLLCGALAVGVIEELLFRGLLFGAFRRRTSFAVAAALSSLLYSLVHFVRPEPELGVAHAHWNAGLRLLASAFRWVHASHHYVPVMLTLFLLGWIFALVYERRHTLHASIGLHAGIVFAMRAGEALLVRNPDAFPFWFGGSEGLPKTYAALAMTILLLLFACVLVRRAGEPDAAMDPGG